jgi:hypothetical protein
MSQGVFVGAGKILGLGEAVGVLVGVGEGVLVGVEPPPPERRGVGVLVAFFGGFVGVTGAGRMKVALGGTVGVADPGVHGASGEVALSMTHTPSRPTFTMSSVQRLACTRCSGGVSRASPSPVDPGAISSHGDIPPPPPRSPAGDWGEGRGEDAWLSRSRRRTWALAWRVYDVSPEGPARRFSQLAVDRHHQLGFQPAARPCPGSLLPRPFIPM